MDERKTKYYLIDKELFELAINFKQMTVNLYKLDSKCSETAILTDSIILATNLTAGRFTNYKDITEVQSFGIVHNCMNMARQILAFKYDTKEKKAVIATFDEYKSAYKKWKESLEIEEAKEKEIKKCTLETVILEDDTKRDILSTINFVKNVEKYLDMGCEVPSGILLEGPPGTGKSLTAKTIASETNMNFKSIVASDLVQKYVGDSAKRIGKEFEDLAKQGGGILFIDEIDAIGIHRSSSDENKEYRAALNKLLDCMANASEQNIIVICATNIKDQLDPALIREGRIDKVINIPLPDFDSRVELFKLYMNKLKHEEDINYLELAKLTEGKSGAFIAACCNHAGIYAVDEGASKTDYGHVMHVLRRMIDKRDNNETTIGFV